jgi:hypothetical protein
MEKYVRLRLLVCNIHQPAGRVKRRQEAEMAKKGGAPPQITPAKMHERRASVKK